MRNGKSFISYVILTLFTAAFSFGPIEQIFYRAPNSSELKTIVGTINFHPGWKGGERIFIRNELGKTVLTCRISASWLEADCPISKQNKEVINGKQVTVRWHKQSRWPLTTSEKQIYEIYLTNNGEFSVLDKHSMDEHYKKQRSVLGSLLILAAIVLFVSTIVVIQVLVRGAPDRIKGNR